MGDPKTARFAAKIPVTPRAKSAKDYQTHGGTALSYDDKLVSGVVAFVKQCPKFWGTATIDIEMVVTAGISPQAEVKVARGLAMLLKDCRAVKSFALTHRQRPARGEKPHYFVTITGNTNDHRTADQSRIDRDAARVNDSHDDGRTQPKPKPNPRKPGKSRGKRLAVKPAGRPEGQQDAGAVQDGW